MQFRKVDFSALFVAVAKKLCREYWGSMDIGFTHQQIWSGCKEWWTTSERVQLHFDGWSRSVGTHEADESSLSTSKTSNDLPWLRSSIDPSYREMFACARRENNDNLEDEERIKLSSKSFHRRTRFHARLKKPQQWSESFGYTNLQMKYLNQRCDTKSGDESGQDWSLIRLVDSICPKRYKCTLIKILVHKSLNALKILVIFNHIYLPIFLCTWYHLVIVSYHFDDIYIRQALFRKGF